LVCSRSICCSPDALINGYVGPGQQDTYKGASFGLLGKL
jgi:hypothetical protein